MFIRVLVAFLPLAIQPFVFFLSSVLVPDYD